jgi:hypothetical protein
MSNLSRQSPVARRLRSGKDGSVVVASPLVSRDALHALAVLQLVPAVAFVIGADLILQDITGPLAGYSERQRGKHLYEILGTDQLTDPVLAAVHHALQGEPAPYVVERHGQWWDCLVAPLRHAGGYVAGVLGIGKLCVRHTEHPGDPLRYVATGPDGETGVWSGDRLVMQPSPAGGREVLVRDLPTGTIGRLMGYQQLRPFTPADGCPACPPPQRVGQDRRLRRGLRLESGGGGR